LREKEFSTYSCSSNARKTVISMWRQNTAFLNYELHKVKQYVSRNVHAVYHCQLQAKLCAKRNIKGKSLNSSQFSNNKI